MNGEARVVPQDRSLTRGQWFRLGLLVLSICINYIDRGTLSVAQRGLANDLHIGPERLGMIFSAFFWTYAPLQIAWGIAVERWRAEYVLAVGYCLWSVAMMATGFVQAVGSLVLLRLLLGAGESVAYPAYSQILARDFSEHQRGRANGFIDAGSKLGPAIAILAGGLAIGRFGWRAFFIATGALSLAWLVPWLATGKSLSRARFAARRDSPPLMQILRQRSAWGTFLGLICGNYVWYFLVFWLPPYFENERHLSHREMSLLGSAPFWGVGLVAILGGWLSDHLIASGHDPNRVRKTAIAIGLLVPTLMIPATLISDNRLSVAVLTLALATYGLYSSNVWAMTQTLAGPSAAGKWTGIQNALGNLSGMVGPWFTGWINQTTGTYAAAFAIATGFLLAGTICFVFVVKQVRPIAWDTEQLPGAP